MKKKINSLLQKGVRIPNPESIEIGREVDIDRISGKDVTLHTGSKVFGSSTLICQGVRIGREGPVTVEDCQIGPHVELKGGFFQRAVFLEKVKMGSGSHVREGTILEEQASVAHTVGLKQTILFPFVTLGSLINFCDCVMSGGTSRKDHSEVGSSYIHFNYTPNQDKATPSLMGDVPRGVMLNQRPIFLGGQGGLVGPCRLAFGTITAAGTICRKDELRPGYMIIGGGGRGGAIPFSPGTYPGIKRIVKNNFTYIANLAALRQWYTNVRALFVSNEFPQALLSGLLNNLTLALNERIKRLKGLCHNLSGVPSNLESAHKSELCKRWPQLEAYFKGCDRMEGDSREKARFLETMAASIQEYGKNYLDVIKSLSSEATEPGIRWLQGIVDRIEAEAMEIVPEMKL